MSALLKRFTKTASVTRNLLKIAPGKEYAVRFTGEMHLGKEIAGQNKVNADTGEVIKKQPAHVAFIDNLDVPDDNTDGYEEMQMIVATVMRKEIESLYPNESYVGKCFVFSQVKVERGYNVPQITEVEDPNPARTEKVLADWKAEKAKKAVAAPAADEPVAQEAATEATETKGPGPASKSKK